MKTDIDAATYIEHETEHAYGEEFRQQLQHSMRAWVDVHSKGSEKKAFELQHTGDVIITEKAARRESN